MTEKYIKIRGAREHNLKNLNLDLPKNKLVVFTGVSGSGKSSLAFDTIYAEGQRRYVESLSTYARQFLGIMDKPEVDSIEGLSPAISIEQKTTSKNPRSTVGTVTEIYDYLRLLYARIGHPHCPVCGREIARQSVDQILEKIIALVTQETKNLKKGWFMVLSPLVREKKGEYSLLFTNLQAKGFKQVRIDGQIKNLKDELILLKTNKHTIEVVIDRLSLSINNLKDSGFMAQTRKRLSDSVRLALELSSGNVVMVHVKDKAFVLPEVPMVMVDHLFSEQFACPADNLEMPEMEPRIFSFNSPLGACPGCGGLGKILKINPALLFAGQLSILEGGIIPFSSIFEHETWYSRLLREVCSKNRIPVNLPINQLTPAQFKLLLSGTGKRSYQVSGLNRHGQPVSFHQNFDGLTAELERRYRLTQSDYVRSEIAQFMSENLCQICQGQRLKNESLSVTVAGRSISETTQLSVNQLQAWLKTIKADNLLPGRETEIADLIFKEIQSRLNFLISVGLTYLTLEREAGTLSGGEAQRIRLASQIGSGLSGVLYVLDEPTIGLHQKDNLKLIATLKQLRDLDNTVLVVEHDREMMAMSDYIFDFGPMAGSQGGEITAHGTPEQIKHNPKSLTGQYLANKKIIEVKKHYPFNHLAPRNQALTIHNCQQYNLKNLTAAFPIGKLIGLTGVSGSGKSTLLMETLYPAVMAALNPRYRGVMGKYSHLDGLEHIQKAIIIDQSPIGRTPRSNPATYTGTFDPIRDLFAQTRESRARGYTKSQFSFNLKGGRCEACEGQGQVKIEMQFMSDLWVKCEVCQSKRYDHSTLEVTYKGKNIAEMLDLSVEEVHTLFTPHPAILAKTETLIAVGLGYIKLGQPATTLSGGEAQRIKLATELSKKSSGRTVYLLDEPTTGLHFYDVERLVKVLRILVDRGNTVVVIEHNLEVIKNCDWVIDLGPEGGEEGGQIIAQGTPKDVSLVKSSYTGQWLKKIL